MRRRAAMAGGIGSLLWGSEVTWSQTNDPSKPTRLIVPFGPGSGVDALGRALASICRFPRLRLLSSRTGKGRLALSAPDPLRARPPMAIRS